MSVPGHPLQETNHELKQPPHLQIPYMLILPVNRY
jgi:hypothetical protein